MRLVTLTTQHQRRKVVIDANKILAMVATTRPHRDANGDATMVENVTEITFANDPNPDGGIVIAEDIDTVVTRIRQAISLDERL